jgi:hypothetical protein
MFNVDLSKVDLSKVLPDRAYELLAGFSPGLFFFFSVLLANPDLVARVVVGVQLHFSIGRYASLAVGLFLAFIVGNAFMLVSTLLQYVFGILYPVKIFIWRCISRFLLVPITERLMTRLRVFGANPARKRDVSFLMQLVAGFHARVVTVAHLGYNDWRSIQGCWGILARELLKIRYGVNWRDLRGEEWTPLFFNLGSWSPEDIRGNMMMIALHATGWAGIAAIRLAPQLRNKYYFLFCLFLILNGVLHDYYVVWRRSDPRVAGYANIRAILREFPKTLAERSPATNPPEAAMAKPECFASC